jgi:hypothetical protein
MKASHSVNEMSELEDAGIIFLYIFIALSIVLCCCCGLYLFWRDRAIPRVAPVTVVRNALPVLPPPQQQSSNETRVKNDDDDEDASFRCCGLGGGCSFAWLRSCCCPGSEWGRSGGRVVRVRNSSVAESTFDDNYSERLIGYPPSHLPNLSI